MVYFLVFIILPNATTDEALVCGSKRPTPDPDLIQRRRAFQKFRQFVNIGIINRTTRSGRFPRSVAADRWPALFSSSQFSVCLAERNCTLNCAFEPRMRISPERKLARLCQRRNESESPVVLWFPMPLRSVRCSYEESPANSERSRLREVLQPLT